MSFRTVLSLVVFVGCSGCFAPSINAGQEDDSLIQELEALERQIEAETEGKIKDQSFDLDTFSDPLELNILPEPLQDLFKSITINNFSIDMEEQDGITTTIIKGAANFANTEVNAEFRTRTAGEGIASTEQKSEKESKIPFIEDLRLQLKQDALMKPAKGAEYTTLFKMGLPKGWKISDTFKDIAIYDPITISNAWIIISNGVYHDQELNIDVPSGATILATISFNDLHVQDSVINKIRQIIGKTVDSVLLYGHINPSKLADSIFKVSIPVPAEKKISFYNLLPLEGIIMPAVVSNALRNAALIKPVFDLSIKGKEIQKIELEAGLSFMKHDIRSRFLFLTLKNKKPGVSAALILSPQWKFSELSPELAALDKIKIVDPMLIVSNIAYDDVDRKIAVETGLNFYSGVILTDALKDVEVLVQKLLSQYVIMENFAFHLHGIIAPDMKKSQLAIEIPVEIGIDFEKMWKAGLIKQEPYIQRITTSSFKASVSVLAAVDISAGIFVKPKSQLKPIEFRGGVTVLPNKIGIYGSLTEFDPVFGLSWLGFGPFGIELGWDFAISSAIAATTGVPVPTDIGLRGELRIGKVPLRTTGKGAFKIELSETDVGNFLIHVEIDQIGITKLLALLADMVKKPALTMPLPDINFVDLKGYLCIQETTIAATKYKPGFDLMAGVRIGNYKGHGEIRISEEGKNLYIDAMMDPVDFPYFKLNTAQFGETKKENVGAKLLIDVGVDRPLKAQVVYINGEVEIPALGLLSKTNFDLKEGKLTADFLGIIFNQFQGQSHLELPSDDITNFVFSCGFKNDFYDYIKEQLPHALETAQEKTSENVDKFKQDIDEFKTKFHGDVEGEIERVNQLIQKTEQKIAQLKQECAQAEGAKKATVCPKNLAIAFELGTQKTALEIYKNGLLKGGRKVVEAGAGGGKQILETSEAVAKKALEAIDNISQGVFVVTDILNIKGASVNVTGKELKAGKLPHVIVQATVKLPNQSEATEVTFDLQFDIKNPSTFFVDFGTQFMVAVANSIQANTHYVINKTPYPFRAHLIGDPDHEYTIPAHATKDLAVETVIRGITLDLAAPTKTVTEILHEEKDLGPGGITYTILSEPEIVRKSPTDKTGSIAKAKFFLHRKPRTFYPGGLVNESSSITMRP